MVDLSPKQKRIVEAKAKGLKNKEIAAVEYPEAQPRSGEVLVSRELKKPHVAKYESKVLAKLLDQNNVTHSQYIMNIGLAMQADKQNQFTGEVVPDITARLQGNKMAERFLKFDDSPTPENLPSNLGNLDEIQAIKYVFNKP